MVTPLRAAKNVIRKKIKGRLAGMSDQERRKQSELITENLLTLPEYISSNRVSVYLSMKDEVQTGQILSHILDSGKTCFIPHYQGPLMRMVRLHSLADYEALPETAWKIKQPRNDDLSCREDALRTDGLDLILMPGLGFTTTSGDRLGRGRGYYDAYLAKCHKHGFKPKTIALAFHEQFVDFIPTGEDDIPMDVVLGPDNINTFHC